MRLKVSLSPIKQGRDSNSKIFWDINLVRGDYNGQFFFLTNFNSLFFRFYWAAAAAATTTTQSTWKYFCLKHYLYLKNASKVIHSNSINILEYLSYFTQANQLYKAYYYFYKRIILIIFNFHLAYCY